MCAARDNPVKTSSFGFIKLEGDAGHWHQLEVAVARHRQVP